MGTPNDQTTIKQLQQMIRALVRASSDSLIPEEQLRQTDTDLVILSATYDLNVRGSIKNLQGFETLSSIDARRSRGLQWDTAAQVQVPVETWEEVLERCNIEPDQRRVIQLTATTLFAQPTDSSLEKEEFTVAVYLTNKGKWLLYSIKNGDARHYASDEQISIHDNVELLWEEAKRRSFEFGNLGYRHGSRATYLPMEIETNLRRVLAETQTYRKRVLEQIEAELNGATDRSAIVSYN